MHMPLLKGHTLTTAACLRSWLSETSEEIGYQLRRVIYIFDAFLESTRWQVKNNSSDAVTAVAYQACA
jgi:hypothetical protein